MKRITSPPVLRRRPKDANKVTTGKVLVVGGSSDLVGAPAMAGIGALRAGAGLVKVAVPHAIQHTVASFAPEMTTAGLPVTRSGGLGASALPVLRTLVAGWHAVVLGPGLGREPATRRTVRSFSLEAPCPLVVDADGLFAWNERLDSLRTRPQPLVLTPHEGEAGRLLDMSSADVRADREAAATRLAAATNAVVVLKGPGTLVTEGTRMYRNRTGGPALATGGTGDVLAGIMGAFLAQQEANGWDSFQAACAAVHVHGLAADRTAGRRDRGLLATELAAGVPDALLEIQRSKR